MTSTFSSARPPGRRAFCGRLLAIAPLADMSALFKKGKKGKKAAAPPPVARAAVAQAPWTRVGRGVPIAATSVDAVAVELMLGERSAAKAAKDYKRADKIAAKLQGMDVAYIDEKREWYVKAPKAEAAKNAKKRKFDDDEDEDDEAAKPKSAAAAANDDDDDDDDASSSDEEDEEEDRLDDSFVAKMQKKDATAAAAAAAPKEKKAKTSPAPTDEKKKKKKKKKA